MIYLKLFFEFFKVGLFSIGGGMATIPFLIDLGNKTSWFTSSDVADMLAVSESTPGPIGVNMSTYVGFNVSGFLGSLVSILGLVTPSVVIIIIIYYLLKHFQENKVVQYVLKSLRVGVIGMIAYALYRILSICLFDGSKFLLLPFILYIVLFFLIYKTKKIHPIIWILTGAILGLFLL